MKIAITILLFSLYRLLHAQDGLKQFSGLDLLGTQLTCNNGNTPLVTCNEKPVDNVCSCSCPNGIIYKQLHPSLWANSTASSLCPQCPPTNFLPQYLTKLTTKPCLDLELQGWIGVDLPHEAHSLDPSKLVTKDIYILEDSIMVVADSSKRCQHFEVYVDGELLGETSGDSPLDDFDCGSVDNCIENHGGSHGYFVLPKGEHTVGLRWVRVTDACKKYSDVVGNFKIFKQCQKDQKGSADQQGSSAQLRACEVRNLEEQRQSSAQLLECQEQANTQLRECKQQDIKNQQQYAAQLSSCKSESLEAQQEHAAQLDSCNKKSLQAEQVSTSMLNECNKKAIQDRVDLERFRNDLAVCTQEKNALVIGNDSAKCPDSDGKWIVVDGVKIKTWCSSWQSMSSARPDTTTDTFAQCVKICANTPDCYSMIWGQTTHICRISKEQHSTDDLPASSTRGSTWHSAYTKRELDQN